MPSNKDARQKFDVDVEADGGRVLLTIQDGPIKLESDMGAEGAKKLSDMLAEGARLAKSQEFDDA